MINWNDKKRLAEQLKFFGAKKQGFISCYAKKPRIKVTIDGLYKAKFGAEALSYLYQDQLARGTSRSAFGFNQMVHAQSAMGGLLLDNNTYSKEVYRHQVTG